MSNNRYLPIFLLSIGLATPPTIMYYAYNYLIESFERTPLSVELNDDQSANRIEVLESGLSAQQNQLQDCVDINKNNKSEFNNYIRRTEQQMRSVNRQADRIANLESQVESLRKANSDKANRIAELRDANRQLESEAQSLYDELQSYDSEAELQ